MAKLNKYNIGDIVGHKQTPTLKFRIIDVLKEVGEQSSYGYAYAQIFEDDELEKEGLFYTIDSGIYLEEDLFLIRKPTRDELNSISEEAVKQLNRFEKIVSDIRSEMNKIKDDAIKPSNQDTRFQLYKLINSKSAIGYKYIGKSLGTERIIEISDDHISISEIHINDVSTYAADYKPIEKYFYFDLVFLDELIESYIGQQTYSLTAYFNTQKEVVLAYRSIDDDIYKEENLSLNSDKLTKEIVSVIHTLLQSIQV